MRAERRMFKNFRTQLIPLAESPIVSNIRSTGAKLSRHKCSKIQATIMASACKSLAQEQPSQQQQPLQLLCSPDTIPDAFATVVNDFAGTGSPPASLYESQLAPLDSVDNEEHNYVSSSLIYSSDPLLDNLTVACSPPGISCSPQLGPSDSVSNRTYSPNPSSGNSPHFTVSGWETGASRGLTVVSEPYWLARSDLISD